MVKQLTVFIRINAPGGDAFFKRESFRNPGIARLVTVERDVKPRNMNFAKVEKRGGGGINREGAFIRINTV